MMQTLIGADHMVLNLAGPLDIHSEATTGGAFQTVILAGAHRIYLNGLRALDVETLSPKPRPLVTVERIA